MSVQNSYWFLSYLLILVVLKYFDEMWAQTYIQNVIQDWKADEFPSDSPKVVLDKSDCFHEIQNG